MKARVVCIGIATLDAVVAVDRLPGSDERVEATDGGLYGGGIAATAAVTLARLGVPVAFVGRVGGDAAGRLISDGLAGEGLDVRGLRLDAKRSPVSAILVESPTGLRTLAPFLGGTAPIELSEADFRACAEADWVHVDERGLAALPALAAAGIRTPISVDDGTGRAVIDLAEVALYGPTARVLRERFPGLALDDAAAACVAGGPAIVAATLGAEGSIAASRRADGTVENVRAPGFDVAPVSTLGAGDVFHGALLAALIDGLALGTALRFANAASALSCRALDGRSAIPNRDELDAWLATDPPTRPGLAALGSG